MAFHASGAPGFCWNPRWWTAFLLFSVAQVGMVSGVVGITFCSFLMVRSCTSGLIEESRSNWHINDEYCVKSHCSVDNLSDDVVHFLQPRSDRNIEPVGIHWRSWKHQLWIDYTLHSSLRDDSPNDCVYSSFSNCHARKCSTDG
jgi:hypothetical protein